jgi:mono/diheme cytochrome c family protein
MKLPLAPAAIAPAAIAPAAIALAAIALAAIALAATAIAGEVKITLPAETGTYKAAPGVELAQAHCTMCHSTEYVATQPPMPRKYWEATVKKMREKFGAPTPEAQTTAIVDYLVSAYGVPDAKK